MAGDPVNKTDPEGLAAIEADKMTSKRDSEIATLVNSAVANNKGQVFTTKDGKVAVTVKDGKFQLTAKVAGNTIAVAGTVKDGGTTKGVVVSGAKISVTDSKGNSVAVKGDPGKVVIRQYTDVNDKTRVVMVPEKSFSATVKVGPISHEQKWEGDQPYGF